MTYRIETTPAAAGDRLEIHGLLDESALEEIRVAARGRSRPLQVVLKEGCHVELAVLDELRQVPGVDLAAESPFLARWLDRA